MYYDSELIKQKIRISTLLENRVHLKTKGNRNFSGLCPFHREKTPSFFVNDDKGTYHCFGCGVHGDIFSFVMKLEGLNYKEALVRLADIADVQTSKVTTTCRAQEKNKLFQTIHEKAMEYYKQQLTTRIGAAALRYIKSRGLGLKCIEQYDLGYSPRDFKGFIDHLKRYFQEKDLIESGVVNKKNNQLYDPLHNRLIFPIKDKNSKVVAFGGRVIDCDQKPKYLNSSGSRIFDKSNHLYGFDKARKAIYECRNVLIVEGYMDVLTLANHNILNVVAPLGTSIKMEQIKLLWSICAEPTICFDNDIAGKTAMQKIVYDTLPHITDNQSLKIMVLTSGKDPDEIIVKTGLSNFRKQIDSSVNLADFVFTTEVSRLDFSSPERQVLLRNNLEKLCLSIYDKSIRKSYQRYFRDKYFKLLQGQKSLRTQINNVSGFKRYFKNKEKTVNLYTLIFLIIKFPRILDNNEIFEDFVRVDLPYNLDRIRKMIFDSWAMHSHSINAVKTLFMNDSAEKIADFFNNTSNSLTHATSYVKRILKSEKIVTLRREIDNLQKNTSGVNNAKLVQRILYLKKNEQAIEKDLGN